jgi:hypothetical protein
MYRIANRPTIPRITPNATGIAVGSFLVAIQAIQPLKLALLPFPFLAEIIASRYGSGLTESCPVSHRVSGREVRSMSDLIPAPSADR